MNEKIKKVFHIVGSFFLGIISTLFFGLLHHRRTDDKPGNNIEQSKRDVTEAADRIDRSSEINEELEHGVDTAEEILRTIREKQQIKDN